jgi:hypothetical protein
MWSTVHKSFALISKGFMMDLFIIERLGAGGDVNAQPGGDINAQPGGNVDAQPGGDVNARPGGDEPYHQGAAN